MESQKDLKAEFTGSVISIPMTAGYEGGFKITAGASGATFENESYHIVSIEIRKARELWYLVFTRPTAGCRRLS